MTKTCTKCERELPLDDFYPAGRSRPGRRLSRCKPCHNAQTLAYQRANPEKRRATHRQHKYGVDADTVAAMHEAQAGTCAICKRPPGRESGPASLLHVDHCHATGRVRGLLCNTCNVALGLFQDRPEILQAAVTYLEAARCESA